MSYALHKDFDAAVPPLSLCDQKDTNECSLTHMLDRFPMGFDEGAAKLVLSYKGTELALRHQMGQPVDDTLRTITQISQKLEEYKNRTESLSQTFSGVTKRYASKAASFMTENSIIFGAAAAGTVVGGGVGGIAGSTAATYPQVFGSAFLEEFHKKDCDLKDEAQIRELLDDEDFVSHARNRSHVYAAKMSSAVFGAGMLAGYVYSSVAKPVAQAGATAVRSLLSGFSGAVRDRGAQFLGDLLAQGVKSAANGATKRAIQSIPARALLLSGAAYEIGHELAEHMEEGHDLIGSYHYEGANDHDIDDLYGRYQGDALAAIQTGAFKNIPEYNRSTLYL